MIGGRRRSIPGAVVALTGGARGIGAATAEALAARGARVAIGDVDLELAEETAARIGATALELDVSSAASWAGFVEAVEQRLGPIDVLVNNAGIMPVGPFLSEDEGTTRGQLDVNLAGVLLGCRAVLGGMVERRRGQIVNIASQAGKTGFAGGVTYCATKFGVVGLSHALGDELRDTGLDVTCVLPGVVNTELSSGLVDTRLAPRVEAAEVAQAIVAAVERPRREVWLPSSGRLSITIVRWLPDRLVARIRGLLGLPDPLLAADPEARAAYAERLERPR